MSDVTVKSLGFIFIILLGYIFKKKGFFKNEDGVLLSKIIMNITLPAALITGTNGFKINILTIFIIFIGAFSNIFGIFFARIVDRKISSKSEAINIINCTGYNIGNFAIPFAASFFEPTALVYMALFDIGNSVFVLGGSYAIAKNKVKGKGGINLKNIFKSLSKSFPFLVYVILFIMAIFKILVPKEILIISTLIGSANGFLAMLMIGIMLEINLTKKQVKQVSKLLGIRYLSNIILAIAGYFLLPIPLLTKQMIVLVLFAPLSTISAVYSKMIDEDNPIPPLANSISMILAIVIMTVLLNLIV